jgi:hypothetical protein
VAFLFLNCDFYAKNGLFRQNEICRHNRWSDAKCLTNSDSPQITYCINLDIEDILKEENKNLKRNLKDKSSTENVRIVLTRTG